MDRQFVDSKTVWPSQTGGESSRFLARIRTHCKGEGYPGIILEAFQAGLPVITTNWRCIPELMDDGCELLVPTNYVDAVENAMMRFITDDALFDKLRRGAIRKGRDFSSQHCKTGVHQYWANAKLNYYRLKPVGSGNS